jgi:hypothetical protein
MWSTVAMPVPPRQRRHVEERTGPEINMANHGNNGNVEDSSCLFDLAEWVAL